MLQAGDGIANDPGHKDIGGLITVFEKLGPQPPRHPSEAGLAPGSLLDASRNKQPLLIGLKIKQCGGQVSEPMETVPSHPAPVLLAGPVTLPAQRHQRPLDFGGTRSLFPGGCTAAQGAAVPSQLVGTFSQGELCWLLLGWLLVGKHHPKAAKCFPRLF